MRRPSLLILQSQTTTAKNWFITFRFPRRHDGMATLAWVRISEKSFTKTAKATRKRSKNVAKSEFFKRYYIQSQKCGVFNLNESEKNQNFLRFWIIHFLLISKNETRKKIAITFFGVSSSSSLLLLSVSTSSTTSTSTTTTFVVVQASTRMQQLKKWVPL